MDIGFRIKKLRNSLGQTQGEFAKELGLPRTGISKIENGSQDPSIDVLIKLFDMRTSFSWLLTGEGPMFRDPDSETSTNLPDEDSGFREAFPDVYSLYREVQRFRAGQPGAAPPIPEFEELDEEARDAVAEFARFQLARQRERESKSPPKPAPALPPAATSSKDEVHEPAPEYGRPKLQIPHIIGAAAGDPREVFVDDMYELSRDKVDGPAKDYVAVTISGTSMAEADINDGDVVIVRRDRDLIDGRIFLVRYEDEYVLKRYRRNADGTERLDYEDGSGRSVVVRPGDWQVIGAFCFVAEKAGRAPV